MNPYRQPTRCHVFGHGTRCELAWLRRGYTYSRSRVEKAALDYELAAEGVDSAGVLLSPQIPDW